MKRKYSDLKIKKPKKPKFSGFLVFLKKPKNLGFLKWARTALGQTDRWTEREAQAD